MVDAAPDNFPAEFTEGLVEFFTKATDIAVRVDSNEVGPTHMFMALLCGKDIDIDNLNQLRSPESPTLLWSVLHDLSADHKSLAHSIATHMKLERPSSPDRNLRPGTPTRGRKRPPVGSQDGPKYKFWLAPFNRHRDQSRPRIIPSPSPSTLQVNRTDERTASSSLITAIKLARQRKAELGDTFVGPYHLLLALIEDKDVKMILVSNDVDISDFERTLKLRKGAKITNAEDNGFPYLAKYATDMTALAREGKLNDTIGRDEEIRRVIQILCRRTKNSAVLIGEPGVGKTAVAEGLAHRINLRDVPEHLKGTIYSLDLGALFAGAGKGEYEARVKGVIDDVMRSQQNASPVILFIDELHLITVGKSSGGQSSGMDAANLLKPALARGQFRCIGATTLAEYREHIEKDGALERRFATVLVNEPTIEEATTILRGTRERYESHHRVWIMDQAIVTAVKLAHRYLTARRLPDSAFDLMDEACASARVSQDMKPEAIDTVEQELLQIEGRIKAIERDNHPEDDRALEEAKSVRGSLETRKKRLEEQQKQVREWWGDISALRGLIKAKKDDLDIAKREKRPSASTIKRLQGELNDLRNRLTETENRGPKVADNVKALNTYEHRRYTVSRSSPDIITPESIAEVVERATKLPVQRLLASDKTRLLGLEDALAQQVVGQPEAVKSVTNAIQLSRTGLNNANRPIASLLFTGPSGTGKTLLSKALAQELFGQTTSMVRIDGSEYSQSHSISRLIGSPPGYVGYDQGGQLTEYVRRTPYCIVLLDEIEKTCLEFLTLFLQVLDEGRLTDGHGRLVDFRNCVIIMTSNVGADLLSAADNPIKEAVRLKVMDRFKDARFPVEFLNRIDDVVMFCTMSQAVMKSILKKNLQDLKQREGMKRLHLDIDTQAESWLISVGISPQYGARPLARVIQRELLNPLSQRLLEGTVKEGDEVHVRLNDKKDGLYIHRNHELPADEHTVPTSDTVEVPSRRTWRKGAN